MDNNVEISLRLKEFIENKFNGNAAAFARELNIFPQTLHKYLNGERKIGGKLISKLSNFGCDINWLLNGELPAANIIREPNETAVDYKIKTFEERITKLESKLFQLTEENETLEEENKLLKHNLAKNIDDSKIQRNNIH